MMSFNKYESFALSSIGHSHIGLGKECQDASLAFGDYNFSAAVVCDGHGGDKHFRSAIGAETAVEICEHAFRSVVKEYARVRSIDKARDIFGNLRSYIVSEWRAAVNKHFERVPFTVEELAALPLNEQSRVTDNPVITYGSTCLFAFVCGKFLYIMQLGDGDIRVLKNGKFMSPIPHDDKLCFGATTSLCDENAISNIRYAVMPIDGVRYCWLSSDGVKNSFCDEKSFTAFISAARKEYLLRTRVELITELKDYLPKLSKQGSCDDMSVACVCKKKSYKIS